MQATKLSGFFVVAIISAFLLMDSQAWAKEEAVRHGSASQPNVTAMGIKVVYKVDLEQLAKKLPGRLMVYRTSPDQGGESQMEAVKKFFGSESNMVVDMQKASGGIFAADLNRLWARVPGFNDEVPPLDRKQILAATAAFLSEINGNPQEKTVRRFSTDSVELTDKEGKQKVLPLGANITYRRILNGYKVIGPGGKIKIFHDSEGMVAGYLRVWRSLKAESVKPLIGVFGARDEFNKNPLGDTLLADISEVNVNNITLAYLERGINQSQNYLQPIYVFDCTAFYKGTEKAEGTRYTRYVAALTKQPEPLWQEGEEYKSDRRRKALPRQSSKVQKMSDESSQPTSPFTLEDKDPD